MNKTLFLAWQDKDKTRQWFPVGRLDVLEPQPLYESRYVRGAELAHEKTGFGPLDDFPEFRQRKERVQCRQGIWLGNASIETIN